jgi:hypothetical protein
MMEDTTADNRAIIDALTEYSKGAGTLGRELGARVSSLMGVHMNKEFTARLVGVFGVPVDSLPGSVRPPDWLKVQLEEDAHLDTVDAGGSMTQMGRLVGPEYNADVDALVLDMSFLDKAIDESIDVLVKTAADYHALHFFCGAAPPILKSITILDPVQIYARCEAFLVVFKLCAGIYFHLQTVKRLDLTKG